MVKLVYLVLSLSLVGSAAAFGVQTSSSRLYYTQRQTRVMLFNAYLDSLSKMVPSSAPVSTTHPPAGGAPTEPATSSSGLTHAPLSYFALNQLTSKGPRKADWGNPHEATRKLADDGILRGGSWWCSQGGWPSPNPKAHTEVFYVLEGYGCLGDADGARHYFGPGDTVIIPKGHTGRWDVNEDIHKVWAVNAHAQIEERGNPIRVQVIHYRDYHTITGSPCGYADSDFSQTFYTVGPTQVGIWKITSESVVSVTNTKKNWFLLLEGVLVVSGDDGTVQRCVSGDTVMLPQGWSGFLDVVEPVKKLWVQAD